MAASAHAKCVFWFGLILGVLSFGIIFKPNTTHAAPQTATIRISPSGQTITVDSVLTVDFKLDTGGQEAGGVGLDVSYSSNLEFLSYSGTSSVFSTELTAPEPENNSFYLERFDLSGSYNGTSGQIVQVRFRVKGTGTTIIAINKADSQVISYEDFSNILQSVVNGAYTFASPSPSPTSTAMTTATPVPSSAPSPQETSSIVESVRRILPGLRTSPTPSVAPVESTPSPSQTPIANHYYVTDLSPLRGLLYRQFSIIVIAVRTAGILAAAMIVSVSLIVIWYSFMYGSKPTTLRIPKPNLS